MEVEATISLSLDDVVSQRWVRNGEDGPEWEPVRLWEVVADKVAEKFLAELVDGDARDGLARDIRSVRDAEVSTRVAALVGEALEGMIEPRLGGEKQTLSEYVVEVAKRTLAQKNHDSHRGRSGETLLDQIIRENVEKAFQAELVTEIAAAKKAAREVVAQKAGEVIAETIERAGRGVTVLDRSLAQKREALEVANWTRSRRAEMKRDLAARTVDAADLVRDPPSWLATMKAEAFVLALPRFGVTRSRKVLAACRISPSKTVGGLSDRQRSVLIAALAITGAATRQEGADGSGRPNPRPDAPAAGEGTRARYNSAPITGA